MKGPDPVILPWMANLQLLLCSIKLRWQNAEPEIAVLFTKFKGKICIQEADKRILLSNESATNEINVWQSTVTTHLSSPYMLLSNETLVASTTAFPVSTSKSEDLVLYHSITFPIM